MPRPTRFAKISLAGLWLLAWPMVAQISSAGAAEVSAERSDYVIGVEDQLRISVWGEPALNQTVIVRPDGKISFPFVNDYVAEGRTSEQVRVEIAEALKSVIRNPNVTVIVEQINSFRVFVLGQVRTQGVLQFRRQTRLLQAIAAAGGLTEFAGKDLVLFRTEAAGERILRLDYRKLMSGERPLDNIYLKPGDTILVE